MHSPPMAVQQQHSVQRLSPLRHCCRSLSTQIIAPELVIYFCPNICAGKQANDSHNCQMSHDGKIILFLILSIRSICCSGEFCADTFSHPHEAYEEVV
jgi:hypothetical protein